MRKRRRSQGTWFPNSTNDIIPGVDGGNSDVQGLYINLGVPAGGEAVTYLLPLTADRPDEGDTYNTNKSLADWVGSEYFLKRIVGKFFAAYTKGDGGFDFVKVGLGFMVARCGDEDANAGDSNIPIGASGAVTFSNVDQATFDNYSPLAARTTREPWIWRRTWILNGDQTTGAEIPRSTESFGSVLDGGHIDAKTKRRVTNDERLWFAMTVCRWPYTVASGGAEDGQLDADIDLRIFAQLRKAHNRGVF